MGHREGQRAFVQITMYNVVLCVYNLYEQILTVILCVHTRIQKKKNTPVNPKKETLHQQKDVFKSWQLSSKQL